MSKGNKLSNYIKYANYTDESLNYLSQDMRKNYNQLIRDSFDLLNSMIKSYNKTDYEADLIYNTVALIKFICSKLKFNEDEILINKKRIKKARANLITCMNDSKNNKDTLLNAINGLDEIILDKNIDPEALVELIKKLVDKKENINIIKKFININKESVVKSAELFDYVFKKTIKAIEENNRDIYYYITLLKIVWTSKVNKSKYSAMLTMAGKSEWSNEINYVINGIKRPYDTDKVLKKYHIIEEPTEFKILGINKRKSNETIITLDKSKTIIRDDAISIRKDGNLYIVTIYVADVGSIIKPLSTVDYDAKNNYKCLYLPKNRINIFNDHVEEKVSLNENKPRKAISLNVVLNSNGEVIDYSLSKDNIIVTHNLSYSYGDKLLKDPYSGDIHYMLNDLNMLSQALKYQNKSKAEYWDKKDANCKENFRTYKSDSIVSELMVLYNRILAEIAKDKKIPYIYRIQEKEYITALLKQLNIDINDWTKNIVNGLYLDSRYSTIPKQHYGLGFKEYSHSSDPCRRYPDTYNQFLLHQFYFRDIREFFDKYAFEDLVEYFNQRNVEHCLLTAEYQRALELKRK